MGWAWGGPLETPQNGTSGEGSEGHDGCEQRVAAGRLGVGVIVGEAVEGLQRLTPRGPEDRDGGGQEEGGDGLGGPGRLERAEDRFQPDGNADGAQPGAHPAGKGALVGHYGPVLGPFRTLVGQIGLAFAHGG